MSHNSSLPKNFLNIDNNFIKNFEDIFGKKTDKKKEELKKEVEVMEVDQTSHPEAQNTPEPQNININHFFEKLFEISKQPHEGQDAKAKLAQIFQKQPSSTPFLQQKQPSSATTPAPSHAQTPKAIFEKFSKDFEKFQKDFNASLGITKPEPQLQQPQLQPNTVPLTQPIQSKSTSFSESKLPLFKGTQNSSIFDKPLLPRPQSEMDLVSKMRDQLSHFGLNRNKEPENAQNRRFFFTLLTSELEQLENQPKEVGQKKRMKF
jgi:hypothetical protein